MERSQKAGSVVFDLGGVLVPSGSALKALAEALGVSVDELSGPYWAHRDAYDLGASPAEYWHQVLSALGRAPDPDQVGRLDGIDAACWAEIAPGTAAMLAGLADRGVPLGILSNAPATLAKAVRAAEWSDVFGSLVFSSDVGLMKPDPLVYRAADDRSGRSPREVVFFDDRPRNVASARAHGWRAHVWTGCDDALAVLAREGVIDG